MQAPLSIRTKLLLMAGLFLLFGAVTHRAYEGYFHADDLDTMAWTKYVQIESYAREFFSWKFSVNNARPTVHFLYYKLLDLYAPYRFAVWLGVLQLLHLLNTGLVWLVLKRLRLDLPDWGRAFGCLVFLFYPACFDAYYKPMFAYDVLCTTFALLTVLFYAKNWVIPSLVMMFAAYRAKELAVTLPAVLLAWEWLLGEKKYWRLLPFFALSASFGLQAAIHNKSKPESPYTFKFTFEALRTTLHFYGHEMFRGDYLAFLTFLPPLIWREKRMWFALAAIWLPLGPLLFLPGRMFAVYLYLPLLGIAAMLALVVARANWRWGVAAAALWAGVGYAKLRPYEAQELELAAQTKAYVYEARRFTRANPELPVLFEGMPPGFESWGPAGVVHYWGRPETPFEWVDSDAGRAMWGKLPVGLWTWRPDSRTLVTTVAREMGPEIFLGVRTPVWQMGSGWIWGLEGCRMSSGRAEMRFARIVGRAKFFLQVIPAPQHREIRPRVRVYEEDRLLGEGQVTEAGLQTLTWDAGLGLAGVRRVRMEVDPTFRAGSEAVDQGICVAGAGYAASKDQPD